MRVAIVSNGNAFSTLMLRPLFDDPSSEICGAVLVRTPPGRGGRVATLVRLGRRTGVRFAAQKAASLALPAAVGAVSRRPVFLDQLCHRDGVACRSVPSANSPEAVAFLRRVAPEILVSVSCPERLDPSVLEIPTAAAINLHWGLLPAYGGISPYFWVLRNGESETGLTVHVMARELDVGPVLRQRRIVISADDTAMSLQLRLAIVGGEELAAAVRELPGSLERARPQGQADRSYFSWPSAADVRALRGRGLRLSRWRDYTHLRREILS